MPFAFRHQPLKGLYLTYQTLTVVFLRVPWWVLRSLSRSWRPRQSWDIKRAVMINFLRHFFYIGSQTGPFIRTPDHRDIEKDVGECGVWVEPVPELVKGELKAFATAASVEAAIIPGYWIHKPDSNINVASPPAPGEKVLYRLHGGAYTRCSAHPSDITATMSHDILEFVSAVNRVFSIEYRLSSTKPFPVANPFPTALIDALAGYNYLVHIVGFSPSDIIIMGDSAGGNLALALTRYLVEYQHPKVNHLPAPPGGLVLVSPWCDLSTSHYTPGSSVHLFRNSDYLVVSGGDFYPQAAFLGPHGNEAAEKNKYISPACKSLAVNFKEFPRTFINAGGAELLLDQIRTLKLRMTEDLGEGDGVREGEGKVKYMEEPDGVHDYLAIKWHEPERSRTLKEIGQWIDAGIVTREQ